MENIVINFQVDNSQLISTIELLQKTGQVSQADAERFKALGVAATTGLNKPLTETQQALNQIALQGQKTNAILTDFGAKSKAAADTSKNSFEGLKSTLLSVGGALGIAFSVAEVINFGKEAVKAYAAAEKSAIQLLGALNGNVTAQESLLTFAKQTSEKFAIPQQAINSQSSFLAIEGRTEAQIQKTILAAIQLSAVTGEDLAGSVFKLNATYEGNIGRLARLNRGFKDLSTSQLENGAAVDLVLEKYNGFAEKGLAGVAGQLQRTQTEIEELKVSIGKSLAPSFALIEHDALLAFQNIISGAKDLFDKNKSILNPANYFGANDSVNAIESNKKLLEEQTAIARKSLEDFTSERLARVIMADLEELKSRKNLSDTKRSYLQAEMNAAADLIRLKQAGLNDEKNGIITLKKLNEELADLKKKQLQIPDPLGTGKAANDAILKQIVDTQKKIDDISGKTAEETRKKQAEALKKLNEDAAKASTELLAAKQKADDDELVSVETNEIRKLEAKQKAFDREKQQALANAVELEKITTAQPAGVTKFESKVDVTTGQTIQIAVSGDKDAVKAFNSFVLSETVKTNDEIKGETAKTQAEIAKIKLELNKKNQEEDLKNTLTAIDLSAAEEKQRIIEQFIASGDFSKSAETELQKQLLAIDENYGNAKIEEEKRVIKAKIAAGVDVSANQDRLGQIQIDSDKRVTDEALKQIALRTQAENELANLKKEVTQAAVNFAKEITDNFFQSNIDNLTAQGQAQSDASDAQAAKLQDELNRKVISQKQYNAQLAALEKKKAADQKIIDAQIAEEKRKQAIANKLLGIFNIGINTAEAVIKTEAELGFILAAPLIPFIIALGAIQAAAVAAQPLPKFHKGRLAQIDASEEMAIIRKDETIFNPDQSRQYAPTFRAIYNGSIKPQLINDYVNLKLKGDFRQNSHTLDTKKLAYDIAWVLRDQNVMANIKNPDELGKSIAKHLPQIDPRKW